jgi:osmotically-inducible protein OsmY
LIASGSHLSHDKTYSPVDRSDQALTRRSSGDEALWRRVMQFLHTRGIRNLAGVHVEVHQGIVVLQGSVGSPHDRWLCITCARRVAGVLNVVDELKVDRRDASFMRRAR